MASERSSEWSWRGSAGDLEGSYWRGPHVRNERPPRSEAVLGFNSVKSLSGEWSGLGPSMA